MRENQKLFLGKKFNLRLIVHLSLFALLVTAGLLFWQTPASLQSNITPENSLAEKGSPQPENNDLPADVDLDDLSSPSCATLAYATTLRFPTAGVTENQLISFNTATPGTLILDVPVGGLNTALSEYLQSIDIRPSTGQMYGLIVQNNAATGASGTIRLVTVNTTTGATTPVGMPTTVLNPGNFTGFDFNPVSEQIRVTRIQTGADANLRINPDTGVVTTDTPLAFAAGDPNFGDDPFAVGAAYTNNVPGATSTTLYDIDTFQDLLVRQGSVGGTPDSPNNGLLTTIGPLGVNTSGLIGFDISSGGTAFAVLDTVLGTGGFGAPGRLYTINLTTGAATLVGPIGGLATRFTSSLALTACPTTPQVTSTGPTITTESCGTPNGAPDPGETITVTLPLVNTGGAPTTALTATLQATGGVINPSAAQNYGVVPADGTPVTRTFTFTVAPGTVCGSDITLTFTVSDGATTFANVTRTFTTGVRSVSLSENFDGVTAPALPAGWTSTQLTGTEINWVTSTTTPSSPPNAAFANDPGTANLAALTSPAVTITAASAQIAFKNNYNTENGFDGMVLEYSTNNGTTWTDVMTGGGTFASGGYNGTLSTGFMNPLPGRMAWTGNSNGYVDTLVNLPAALNGQSVRFRWLMGSDSSVAGVGVRIDDVRVLGARVCQTNCLTPQCQLQRRNDFTGDGRTDFSVFRPSTGTWYIQPNGGGAATGRNFGAAGDRLQPADYDGDGRTDLGVYRNGVWYWVQSSDNAIRSFTFGAASDIPVAGDYTGDAKADLAVYRPSTGVWYVRNTDTGVLTAQQWGGAASDIPAVGDFDGDCKLDFAVRRTTGITVPSATEWIILQSGGGATSVRWGTDQMQMAIGDYNGDNRSDVGVADLRGGLLYWYVIGTVNNVIVNGIQFGQTGDIVTVGNYDGDGTADLSVFRPSNGVFYYRAVGNATQFGYQFGASGDIPTARANQYPLP